MILINISKVLAGLTVAGLLNFLTFMAFMLAVFGRLDLAYLFLSGLNAIFGTLALIAVFITKQPSLLAGLEIIFCGLVIAATGFFLIYPIFYAGGAVVLAGVIYMIGTKFVKPVRRLNYR